ncbi:MAG: precorrin-6A/cobalt-precorrin-6A reductase [Finegoldia magna]|nr:precorrin-6A/cobalt-precorrin-6A reductase [Finegoldia magna]
MIWIVGGTKDSRDILQKLVEERKEDNIIVSTATAYGGELLKKYTSDEMKNIQAISEKLNEEQMKELIKDKNISLIIDASHPYAINVSNSVIKVTEELGVEYIRFERKMLDYGTENVVKFDTLEEINDYVRQFEGKNILSTMGSNNLGEIKEMSEKNNLYVRILPTTASIQKAEEYYFQSYVYDHNFIFSICLQQRCSLERFNLDCFQSLPFISTHRITPIPCKYN